MLRPNKLSVIVNGKSLPVDVEPDTPMHWVLHDELDLNATRFSCGIGEHKKINDSFLKSNGIGQTLTRVLRPLSPLHFAEFWRPYRKILTHYRHFHANPGRQTI